MRTAGHIEAEEVRATRDEFRLAEAALRAVEVGDAELLRTVIDHPLGRRVLDISDGWGRTPLLNASLAGRIELCELLVTAGADAARRDTAGRAAADFGSGAGAGLMPEVIARGLDIFRANGVRWADYPPAEYEVTITLDGTTEATALPFEILVQQGLTRARFPFCPHSGVWTVEHLHSDGDGESCYCENTTGRKVRVLSYTGRLWLAPEEIRPARDAFEMIVSMNAGMMASSVTRR